MPDVQPDTDTPNIMPVIASDRDDYARLVGLFRLLQGEGLSLTRLVSLAYLVRHEPVTIRALSTELQIAAPSMSQAVDQLVHSGLVLRSEAVHDRRVKQITLTDAGHQLIARLRSNEDSRQRDRYAQLPPELRLRLTGILEECRAALSQTA